MVRALRIGIATAGMSFITVSAASAQATSPAAPKAMEHHAMSSGWKELDAFHEILAATWHPAASNDLKPIRAKADSLSASAKRWAASTPPAACATKPITEAIADVVTGSSKVADLVTKRADDKAVRDALHDVHERFEVVEGGCHAKH